MNVDDELFGAEILAEVALPDDEGPRDPEGWHALVQEMVEEAVKWRDENLDPEQKLATDYYKGRPFGNEEKGRSQVVLPVVRDVVMAKMPSLMRIFFGPERVVEFKPRGPEDEAAARQQTEYVNYIVTEDNPGFMTIFAALQDAEVRKLGIVKWWWDETVKTTVERFTGLTTEQFALLTGDPDVEAEVEQVRSDPMFGALIDCRVTRYVPEGRARIAAVPPEEFVWNPGARSLDEARMVAHVRDVPADELIAMGVPEDVVAEAKSHTRKRDEGSLAGARRIDGNDEEDDDQDDATRPVRYAEVYARLDMDEDGISELRCLKCVGPNYEIVNGDGLGEVVSERPFALFCPNPEAHAMIGMSDADLVMDIQKIQSAVLRGALDSLSLTLSPATEVVEGEVNMADVMNTEVGRIVRTRKPGMMREISTPFVGAEALSVLGYLDTIKENRTGISKAAAGLDADALQSSTKAAVAATLSGAQQHIELTARIYAETGMKQLFKGLLRLIVRHQDAPRLIRLRNEYVEVDPRSWDASMDVTVNVALGQGTAEDKLQALAVVLEKQEMMLQMGVPLVGLANYRSTLGRAVELLGFKNSDEFFKPWTEQHDQQMEQQKAQQPPPPDPTMMLAQIEQQKAEMQAQIDQQKLELERWKAQMQEDRERDKMARDYVLREHELEMKHAVQIEDAKLKAQVARERASLDADIKREQAMSTPKEAA